MNPSFREETVRINKITPAQLGEFKNHEAVYEFSAPETGLRGFVAIHRFRNGHATGGTRMMQYEKDEDALKDVLRLSEAMTYKCAVAGLPYGGSKVVIIGDAEKDKSPEFLHDYAKVIDSFKGTVSTGEDVGIDQNDVDLLRTFSKNFLGSSKLSGDPSPYAALSTFHALEFISKEVLGKPLSGLTVAIKGVGKVGRELTRLLTEKGAKITIADINEKKVAEAVETYRATRVEPEKIHTLPVDVYAPCALGNEFNEDTVNEIRAKVICGAANNQLATFDVGDTLFRNNIFYGPDYIVNAGGLINVTDELEWGGYNHDRVLKKINALCNSMRTVIDRSRDEKTPPHRVADEIARERI